ncbi:hypothetical protein BpHYR1_035454 [Brachionus plicatilis]|uniref:Uncharacterized protein n=1 Tax=Brachionus plicatilis TaxID=10195 RepID=A0A3M7SRA3_BRAPC|nr:hypothetical protein BpHYR1_035454 [Brachionus plicatilis]
MTQSCPNISLTQFKKSIRDCYLMMHDVGGIFSLLLQRSLISSTSILNHCSSSMVYDYLYEFLFSDRIYTADISFINAAFNYVHIKIITRGTPSNIVHHEAFNKLKLLTVSNRLFELSERYVGTGLSHSIPLVVRLGENKEGFESRYIEYPTPFNFIFIFLGCLSNKSRIYKRDVRCINSITEKELIQLIAIFAKIFFRETINSELRKSMNSFLGIIIFIINFAKFKHDRLILKSFHVFYNVISSLDTFCDMNTKS